MRSHAKASTAGSTQRQASGLGRFFRGASVERGVAEGADGSGALSQRRGPRLVLTTLLATAALCLAPSLASAAQAGFEFQGAFGPDGTTGTAFSTASAVAVDQADDIVYVLDRGANALYKFDLEGNPVAFGGSGPDIVGNELSGLSVGGGDGETQIAVDATSHVIYLPGGKSGSGFSGEIQAFQSSGEPALFTAGPGAGTNTIGGFEQLTGLAVDSAGNIYAGTFDGEVSIFRPTGSLLTAFNQGLSRDNIAVDSVGRVYVTAPFTQPVDRYIPSQFPATVATTFVIEDPAKVPADIQPFGVAIDRASTELYLSERNPVRVAVFDEEGEPVTTFGEGGLLEDPEGVAVASQEEVVFVAQTPESNPSRVAMFKREVCICAPEIEFTRASEVTADSVRLHAAITPQNLETTYWFEYGPAECNGVAICTKVPLVGASIGDGRKSVSVTQLVSGLAENTTYHIRVVAKNEEGVTKGPSRTITTQVRDLDFGLSDSRVWEMVSPPDKRGAMLTSEPGGIIQAAQDGDGLVYATLGSIEAAPEGNRAPEQSSVISTRGADGWHSKDITPPHVKTGSAGYDGVGEYKLMTPDLGRSLMEGRDDAPLSPLTTERTPYLRESAEPPLYSPLLTSKEGFANVPPGTVFDPQGVPVGNQLAALGASRSLSHVVFRSPAPLVPGASNRARYVWHDGQIQPLSELPAGEGGGVVEAELGAGVASTWRAVSDDGNRVFWEAGEYTGADFLTGLYLRDTVAEKSIRLDLVESGAGAGTAKPNFQTASSDGTVVYFTDSRHLTEDASPEGRDLYRCEIPAGAAPGGCTTLTDVSAPLPGSGGNADVRGQAPAVSEDGKRIYFVAEGVLSTVPNQEDDVAIAGEPNLYLWEAGEGIRFIAMLSGRDSLAWGVGLTQTGNSGVAAWVSSSGSPSGRYLAFMSQRSLTGYDNSEVERGKPAQEVFRYDASDEELICVSCNPTNATPQAQLTSGKGGRVDQQRAFTHLWLAGNLPQARLTGGGFGKQSFYRPRAVLDNGRIFFNAFDSLVPADSNGDWDVYQYQPTAVGSCTASSQGAAVSRSGAGCVSLISSGSGDEEAAFLDASPSGDDVFFLSSARLSALDEDDVYDVYDARVNGRTESRVLPSQCLGEACQPPSVVPQDPTPASSSFIGPGNTNAGNRCPKGKRKVRRNGRPHCVRKHRRHHPAANSKRRAHR